MRPIHHMSRGWITLDSAIGCRVALCIDGGNLIDLFKFTPKDYKRTLCLMLNNRWECDMLCLTPLSSLTLCVFLFLLQLNPDVNVFQRKFVNEVRRCEEMDRKLSQWIDVIQILFPSCLFSPIFVCASSPKYLEGISSNLAPTLF